MKSKFTNDTLLSKLLTFNKLPTSDIYVGHCHRFVGVSGLSLSGSINASMYHYMSVFNFIYTAASSTPCHAFTELHLSVELLRAVLPFFMRLVTPL